MCKFFQLKDLEKQQWAENYVVTNIFEIQTFPCSATVENRDF